MAKRHHWRCFPFLLLQLLLVNPFVVLGKKAQPGGFFKKRAAAPRLHPDAVEKTCFSAERIPSAMPYAMTLLFSDNIAAAVWASTCHLLFLKHAAMLPVCRNAVEEQPKASPSVLHPHTTFTTASVLLQLYRRFFPTCYHRCPWLLLSFSPKNWLINRSINWSINRSINCFILSYRSHRKERIKWSIN